MSLKFKKLFFKYFLLVIVFMFSTSIFAIVKIENIKQGGSEGKGIVRIYMSSNYNLDKIELSYGKDYAELIFADAFIIPATKRIFKASSAKASVLRMEAELLNGTKVSVKIYFKLPIDLIKQGAELKLIGSDVAFYYQTKNFDIKTPASTDIVKNEIKNEGNFKEAKKDILAPQKSETYIDEEIIEDTTEHKSNTPSLFWSFVRMIMVLIFVVGVFILGVYFFKKYYKGPISLYGKAVIDPNIKVIGKLSLEFGKNIYIISVGGQKHLIATSKDRVSYLSMLNKNEATFEEKLDQESILLAGSKSTQVSNSQKLSVSLKDRLKEKKNL